MRDDELAVCAVLSGNRNFEGRIHPLVRASYLASPPLVVAYALAGSISIDLEHEPLGTDSDGADVYLRDLWPSSAEVRAAVEASVTPELFEREYATIWDGDERWRALPAPEGALFAWDPGLDLRARAVVLPGSRARARAAHRRRGRALPRRCSATRSRPTTSRRPARSRATCPRAAT